MRKHFKFFSLLFLLFTSTNTILPITIHASVWSKTLETGKKQRIFLFGDRHLWLSIEPETTHQKIIAATELEKESIIHYAQLLNALVVVEDLSDYNPTGIITKLRKKLFGIFGDISCCSNEV